MQLLLEALLHPKLANVVGAAVIALVLTLLDGLLFALVDAPYVAHHMATQFTIRVTAKQPRLDVDARKTEALSRKACHFLVGQARADRQGFKIFGLVAQSFEAALVA